MSQVDIGGSGSISATAYPYIIPENYGAVGNGSTDDTTAIQAAIDAATLAGNLYKPILFKQATTYRVSSLTLRDRTCLVSAGGRDSSAILKSNSTDVMLVLPTPGAESFVRINGLFLNGNSTATALIDVNGNSHFELSNCSLAVSAIGVDHSDGGFFNRIINNRIATTIGIQISGLSNGLLIQKNVFVKSGQTFCVVSDTASESDCIQIIDNIFENNSGTCCVRLLASINNQNLSCNIARNRFDAATSHSLIHIGETVSANIYDNSIANPQDHLIYIDGRRCNIYDNYLASSTDSAIYLSATSTNNVIHAQKWCTGGDACASEYEDLGTNNIRFDPTRLASDNGDILSLGDSGSLTGNDKLKWSETNIEIQVDDAGNGTGYYGATSAEIAVASGVGAKVHLTDDGTGTWTVGQNSSGHLCFEQGFTVPTPVLKLDKTTEETTLSAKLTVTNNAVINEVGGDYDTRIEGDSEVNLFYVDASTDRIGIGTASPGVRFDCRGGAIFNEDAADFDFRVEGDTDANMIFVDASTDRLGVGTGSPANKLHVYFNQGTPLGASTYTTFFEGRYNPNNNAPTYFLGAMTVQCHNYSGTYTVEDVRGLHCIAGKAQAGGVTTAYAGTFYVNNESASNAITTAYNIYVYQPYVATSGSTATCYGIMINPQKPTGVTTGYAIYSSGADDLTYFAGYIGIATAASTTYRLNIGSGYVNVPGTSGNTYRWNASTTAPSTTAAGSVTNRYGGATNFLGDPNAWALVRISGADYKIPLYS